MSWKERQIVELRKQFVVAALEQTVPFAQLCREFEISRPTGYKWVERFKELGESGLENLSKTPRRIEKYEGEIVFRILELRRDHPKWGAKKIWQRLVRTERSSEVPNPKTIARILDRLGEPRVRKPWKRLRVVTREKETLAVTAPNDVWTIDFKGWWRAGDGRRCEPLTVRDAFSRYVLAIEILPSTRSEHVRDACVRLFMRYGLPKVIRVDNGSPFGCTRAPVGLTKLSAWWTSLGIRVSFSRPGHPEDNGGHERMHRDVAEELEACPAPTLKAQQLAARRWQKAFNYVRPHDALKGKTPSQLYLRSARAYEGIRTPSPMHGYEIRRVRQDGCVKAFGRTVFLSESLGGHDVAVRKTRRGQLAVRFHELDLGLFEWKNAPRYKEELPFTKPLQRSRKTRPSKTRAA